MQASVSGTATPPPDRHRTDLFTSTVTLFSTRIERAAQTVPRLPPPSPAKWRRSGCRLRRQAERRGAVLVLRCQAAGGKTEASSAGHATPEKTQILHGESRQPPNGVSRRSQPAVSRSRQFVAAFERRPKRIDT